MSKIENIQKLNTGRYLLNNSVIISELEYKETGVGYKLDYEESIITAKAADELGTAFIVETLNNMNNSQTSDNDQ